MLLTHRFRPNVLVLVCWPLLAWSIRDSSLELDEVWTGAEDSSLDGLGSSTEADNYAHAREPGEVTVDDIQRGHDSFNNGDNQNQAPKPATHQHAHGNEHRYGQPHYKHPHGKIQPKNGHGKLKTEHKKAQKGEDEAEENEEGEVEAEAEEGEEGEEEGEEPWEMTFTDKLLLEIGWLILFIALCMMLISFMSVVSQLSDSSKDVDDGIVEPSALAQGAYWFDCHIMDPLVILTGLANFVVFAAKTEMEYDEEATSGFGFKRKLKTWVPETNAILQKIGVVVLSTSLLLRALSAPAHPWWKAYRSAAPFIALLINAYAWIDVIAMTPSVLDFIFRDDAYYNIQSLCLVRLVEMAVRMPSATGAGIRAFIAVFDEDGPLIGTIFAFGAVVWVMFSGLYMVANRTNAASVWEAATYQGEPWQRFESLPSSMFFALLNLCKEHPLADVFGDEEEQFGLAIFQRVIIIMVCIIGVPVFGVPTGILGASLMKHCDLEVKRLEEAKAKADIHAPIADAAAVGQDEASALAPAAETFAEAPAAEAPPTLEGKHVHVWLTYTLVVSFGSTFLYFFYTLHEDTVFLFMPIPEIPKKVLAPVDAATSVVFFLEFVARLFTGGLTYITGIPLLIIDVLAFLPGFCSAGLWFGSRRNVEWVQALCVLRVLKAERYVGAFASMFSILSENGAILKATALTTFLLWLFVSSILHFTEKDNPDEELQEVYASVPRALWTEIINLHGEWPWCDYTWVGKAIGTLLNFASIGICMIPVVVFSDGFIAKVAATPSGPDGETLTMSEMAEHRWQLAYQDSNGFHLLYAHLLPPEKLHQHPPSAMYGLLRFVSISFVFFATFNTVMDSLPSLSKEACDGEDAWPHCHQLNQFFVGADAMLAAFFTVEFISRVVVLRGMYLLSFIGIVDLLSLSAFLVTLGPAMHDAGLHPNYEAASAKELWRDLILPLRLMRLMMLESWAPAIQSLCDVIWMQAAALRKACYALVCVWYMFTVSLYVLERDSADEEISARFENVLVGLPHGLIHLTGDYPCTNYSSLSVPFHLVFLILGMCCTGTFTGIFAGGFVEYLGAQRDMERRQAAEERVRIMVAAVSVLQRRVRARQRQTRGFSGELPRYNQVTMQKAAQRLLKRQTSLGRVFVSLAQAALMVNILNTIHWGSPQSIDACGSGHRACLCHRVLPAFPGTSAWHFHDSNADHRLRVLAADDYEGQIPAPEHGSPGQFSRNGGVHRERGCLSNHSGAGLARHRKRSEGGEVDDKGGASEPCHARGHQPGAVGAHRRYLRLGGELFREGRRAFGPGAYGLYPRCAVLVQHLPSR